MIKFTIFSFISILLISCGSTSAISQSKASQSLNIKSENKFKGDWTLTKVTYVGQEYFKITSFQVADSKCFEGSTWNFIPNNEKGSFTLNSGSCPSYNGLIVWSVNKENTFSMKFVNGAKAKDVKLGYNLIIKNQSQNSFELVDQIEIGGKKTDVNYRFEKN